MKVFICCSKHHYWHISPIKEQLEKMWHTITLPNSYYEPTKENNIRSIGPQEHANWKASMIRLSIEKIWNIDAMLVVNMEKNGQTNYIGWATFLEVFKARELGKKIYFYNPLPVGILYDELCAIDPIVINGDISLLM